MSSRVKNHHILKTGTPLLHRYSWSSLDGRRQFKKFALSDSGCDKTVMAKNLLDRNQVKYDPNLEGERLQAAGAHELQVCGVLQLDGTYNGNTITMDCLVTPDLDNEAIVSATDAEAVGAISRNRAETNQPTSASKHTVHKCKNKKRVRFNTEGEEPMPQKPAPGEASSKQREAPEIPSILKREKPRQERPAAYQNGEEPQRTTCM